METFFFLVTNGEVSEWKRQISLRRTERRFFPEMQLESVWGTPQRKGSLYSNSSRKFFISSVTGPNWFIGTHLEPLDRGVGPIRTTQIKSGEESRLGGGVKVNTFLIHLNNPHKRIYKKKSKNKNSPRISHNLHPHTCNTIVFYVVY